MTILDYFSPLTQEAIMPQHTPKERTKNVARDKRNQAAGKPKVNASKHNDKDKKKK